MYGFDVNSWSIEEISLKFDQNLKPNCSGNQCLAPGFILDIEVLYYPITMNPNRARVREHRILKAVAELDGRQATLKSPHYRRVADLRALER